MAVVKSVSLKSMKKEVLEATDEAIERALTTVGIEWQGDASAIGPVVTGRLMASLNYVTIKATGSPNKSILKAGALLGSSDYTPKSTPKPHTVVLGTNVWYAEKIEEGGAREARHSHFIRGSLTNNIDKYRNIIMEELQSSMK